MTELREDAISFNSYLIPSLSLLSRVLSSTGSTLSGEFVDAKLELPGPCRETPPEFEFMDVLIRCDCHEVSLDSYSGRFSMLRPTLVAVALIIISKF
jgi:hypothetical protein